MVSPVKVRRAAISWEGDSLDVLREWPKGIREDFGVALGEDAGWKDGCPSGEADALDCRRRL